MHWRLTGGEMGLARSEAFALFTIWPFTKATLSTLLHANRGKAARRRYLLGIRNGSANRNEDLAPPDLVHCLSGFSVCSPFTNSSLT